MKITVFTPTYNRCHLLPRLYGSLRTQTCCDFEWIVVDDGSTDDTKKYIHEISRESQFPLKYIYQKNSGKYRAHNAAVQIADGELFICVDSDDMLSKNAIETILLYEKQLKEEDCGFVAMKINEQGRPLCTDISNKLPHVGLYALNVTYGIQGEFSLVFRTELLRKNLYPVIENEKFLGECVLYDRFELKGYTFCPLPAVLTICEYQEDGLTSQIYSSLLKNPTGYQIFHMQRIDLVKTWKERVRHSIQYEAFRCISHNMGYRYHGKYKWLVMLAHIPGVMGAQYYKKKCSS